jgi:CheY-like chemotaxis protein
MGILALFLIVTDAQIDNSLVYFDIAILCFYMFLKYIARFHRVIEYNNWENERTQSKLIKKNHDLEMATHNFASYIHHEINNPLNNASLLLSQLQLDDDDKCPEYKQIINDIHSIKHVMDDASWFLDMVKSDIHVDDIAGDVLTMINDIRKIFQYSENVTWEVSNEGHNNIFLPSMNRIKKVLIILIRNLLSTYNDGYSVHIDARFQERIVTINIVQKPLLQEHQPPIAYHNDAAKMEDHARWDNLSRNLALGILQVNNCDTDIQFSVPGQVIGIKLICVGILEEQSVPPPIIVENHRSTTMHILIVDDNSITRKLIGRFLTTTNYTYEEACDGIECIEKLSKTAFDLIILDTVMPNLGGKGVLQYMINNEIYTPVISISANSSPSDVAELTELGVLQVLGKPIIFEKLQEYIKNVEDK